MQGRKPKPTALKQLHGNPGQRPLNKNEPKFRGKVHVPKWVPKLAKEEFRRIMNVVGDIGLMTAADQAALEGYIVSYARWRQAEAIVEREGIVTRVYKTNKAGELLMVPDTVTGEPTHIIEIKRHPATIVAKDSLLVMQKFAALFGFDPSSRSRVQLPDANDTPEEDDGDDDLIAKPTGDEVRSGAIH